MPSLKMSQDPSDLELMLREFAEKIGPNFDLIDFFRHRVSQAGTAYLEVCKNIAVLERQKQTSKADKKKLKELRQQRQKILNSCKRIEWCTEEMIAFSKDSQHAEKEEK
ncbi:hypothetical protein [Tunicatimonas pelagia]|uniref:hypothetical protein n=1 Tax=Tunicatimonas pelagia TaxID=931531 RepID=UPI002666B874|nr:hypothetical protein [Tunicatimonas pelagia]WKN42212.1 hypothetical protein P0M28_24550 [Tunicatimonas pelagia]WKN45330.1 hypothetical protein P0M28_10200 [Tunicatimonas pelagia]